MRHLVFKLSPLLALAGSAVSQCFKDLTFSPLLHLGPSEVQFMSCGTAGAVDAPRVNPINATTFDWWYFDAVSLDGSQALSVVFFTSSFIGFSFDVASLIDPLNVWIFANFGDGPALTLPVPATSVEIQTDGNDGVSGKWADSGISFSGALDLSNFNVTLDNTLLGLKGTFSLKSRGPGHYACAPLGEGGVDEHIIPHIGWVNPVPAADASVDVTLLGKKLRFQGNGYHDKNWGDVPFTSALKSWYWGHGTFGDYQIVFFDAIDNQGTERASGYVLLNGKVIGSTCVTSHLKVRPVGAPYPPKLLTPNPKSFSIDMTLNDGSLLHAVITQTAVQTDVGLYARWIGTIEGTVHGVTSSGSALWDQIKVELL
ncbi:hypothetical protein F5884DRAFT_241189 [Xylogone sp. PMI_703]|nr:hypothetical protein F5884DRAFT_241189 [Xylogone sp. PMI_703]